MRTHPDKSLERALELFAALNQPVRLRIIVAASDPGGVKRQDLTHLAATSPGSGTLQYHISHLIKAGLLRRAARGRYALTPTGNALLRFVESL